MDAIQALDILAAHEARESFYAFRQHISTKVNKGRTLKTGWFVRDLCWHLQQFYDDLVAGKKPELIIEAPPQHGKSVAVIEFIAWLSGKHPELQTIYASFSDRLGARANLRLRRIFRSEKFKQVFPDFVIGAKGSTMNMNLLEYSGNDGLFRNTTVMGSITGETLNLGVIDDPMKGREQANSETIREKTWDWFTDDFFTRFDENAGLLAILTRWHVDDPIGRLLKAEPNIKVLKYRAIATEDEKHRKAGEALFPEHKSLEFIEKRRKILGSLNFESLYQQNPMMPDGDVYKYSWFLRHSNIPEPVTKCIHSWDTASKDKERNDPSACTVWMIDDANNRAMLKFVFNKRMLYPELKKKVAEIASMYPPDAILIEDKDSGQQLIQDTKQYTNLPVIAITPKGSKITRAETSSFLVEAGRVSLPNQAPWLAEYETQILGFPNTEKYDMVDSTSQFLNWWRSKDKNDAYRQQLLKALGQ
jgi:predicted phage terminase large subunit-like protein